MTYILELNHGYTLVVVVTAQLSRACPQSHKITALLAYSTGPWMLNSEVIYHYQSGGNININIEPSHNVSGPP
jgi:hypothetical protein